MSEEQDALKTPLYARHVAEGAELGEEGEWVVPLYYAGGLEEAAEVRRRAGVFDLTHLGRIRIRGDGALDLLERACTGDVAHQEDDTAAHALLCNERGGVLADSLLLRLPDCWLMTTAAICRRKVLEHLQALADELDAKVDDQTEKIAHLSVCGPETPRILDAVLPMRVSDIPAGAARTGSLMIARYIAMRTAYTGEWSLEVVVPNMMVRRAWDFITKKAGANAVLPAGVVARDVLRIEAGMCRYGHELNETIDPLTAGLERLVDFDHDFIGRDALDELRRRGPRRKRVGLAFPEGEGVGGDIPRQGWCVREPGGAEIGAVTSGTYSPALDRTIAMAYVARDKAGTGAEVLVHTGSEQRHAVITSLPFRRKVGNEQTE